MKSTEDLTRDVLNRAAKIKEKQRTVRRQTGIAATAIALALTVGLGTWGITHGSGSKPEPTRSTPGSWIDAQTATLEPTIGIGPTEISQSCYAAGVRYQGNFYSELVQLDGAHAKQFLQRLDLGSETLLGDTRDIVNQTTVTRLPNANTTTTTATSQTTLPDEADGTTPLGEPASANQSATTQPPTGVPDDRTVGYGMQGMLYTVAPYDPQFILAVVNPHDNGTATVWLVWKPDNQPARTGRDFLEDVLHLTDRVESASWMSDTLGDTNHPLQVDADTLQKLVDALNAAPVTRLTDREYGALSESGKRYVQLTAVDGLQIELTLYENGLVGVQGMYDSEHMCQQLLQPDDPIVAEIYQICR